VKQPRRSAPGVQVTAGVTSSKRATSTSARDGRPRVTGTARFDEAARSCVLSVDGPFANETTDRVTARNLAPPVGDFPSRGTARSSHKIHLFACSTLDRCGSSSGTLERSTLPSRVGQLSSNGRDRGVTRSHATSRMHERRASLCASANDGCELKRSIRISSSALCIRTAQSSERPIVCDRASRRTEKRAACQARSMRAWELGAARPRAREAGESCEAPHGGPFPQGRRGGRS
jgi:hypothetical protein